jgi:PQQ-dependent catabolism-associated CXXCW motif protein
MTRAASAALRRVAVALGLLLPLPGAAASTVAEPQHYWTGPINGPVPATLRGAAVIHLRGLLVLRKHGDVLLVDVSDAPRRPPNLAPGAPWLPLPHRAIPDSVWIPGAGLGEVARDVESVFQAQLASGTGNDKRHRVVIYCHERCWLSWNAARRAISYGYRRVYWYPDGVEGWSAARQPTAVIEPAVAP